MSISQSTGDESAEVRLSEKFNAPDSDIMYQSSDNVRFLVHKNNLRITAPGFPLKSEHQTDPIIHLPETETVLDSLFRFCYPERHPDLTTLDFERLISIAEAAEEYRVFAAINICSLRMRKILPQHAVEIMAYAAKNNYHRLLEESLSSVTDEPLSKILPILPSHLVIPWVLHREKYVEILRRAIKYFHTMPQEALEGRVCLSCGVGLTDNPEKQVLQMFLSEQSLSALFNLSSVFDVGRCNCGLEYKMFTDWRGSVEADIHNIPKFSCTK